MVKWVVGESTPRFARCCLSERAIGAIWVFTGVWHYTEGDERVKKLRVVLRKKR